MTAKATTATPAPIPAFAPVDSPDDEEDVVVFFVDDVPVELPVFVASIEDVEVATQAEFAAQPEP